jgi:hypothetical protein
VPAGVIWYRAHPSARHIFRTVSIGAEAMLLNTRGLSTIECLIAITILSIGALGNVAASAYALRTVREGNRAVRAARLLSTHTGRLRQLVRQAGGSCSALTAGRISGTHGEQLSWSVGPGTGGAGLTFVVSFPTVRGQRADTAYGFLQCQ